MTRFARTADEVDRARQNGFEVFYTYIAQLPDPVSPRNRKPSQ